MLFIRKNCFYITCEVYMFLHWEGPIFLQKYSNFPENGVA